MQSAASSRVFVPEDIDSTITGKGARLLFVDNIRIFLTMLVIAHHLMIIYAGSGGWIHYEGRQDDVTSALAGWFCAVNQAYFMGLFLFVAAYFVPGAYDRKGPGRFLKDRAIRLGIPLALYSWLLRPLFIFFVINRGSGSLLRQWYAGEYLQRYGWIGGGPLWFIEVLLLFSLFYVVWRGLTGSRRAARITVARFPSNGAIALFAVGLGAVSFLVRLISPVNDTFIPLNLQFANFTQYIGLFIVGVVAYRRDWLSRIPRPAGRLWLGIGLALILLYGPLAVIGGATEDVTSFLGGWHWQALMFALWDAFLCVSMCIGLLSLFQYRLNRQGGLAHELSRSAYAAYIIHEPAITILAIMATGLMIHPLIKFVLACVVAFPLCFGLGGLMRRLPQFDRVL
jgi:glucan biosynthesis protein C